MGHYKQGFYTDKLQQERSWVHSSMPSGERDDYSTYIHNFIYANIIITKGFFVISSEFWTLWWAIETYKTGRDYMNILKLVIFEGAQVASLVVEKSKF
jgi:hypothetical protein